MKIKLSNSSCKNIPVTTAINNIKYVYPWLSNDETTSVCIIGNSITAAIYTLEFASIGIKTVLLSPTKLGFGQGAESDPIASSTISGKIFSLSKHIGLCNLITLCNRCESAMNWLETFTKENCSENVFFRADSLVYTTNEDLEYELRKEYLFKLNNNLKVDAIYNKSKSETLSKALKKLQFGLIRKTQDAFVDPYRLMHTILNKAVENGAVVYENSPISRVLSTDGIETIQTDTGCKITASKLVFTNGSQLDKVLKHHLPKKTAFSIITQPIEQLQSADLIFRIIKRIDYPEFKIIVTPEHRIIATGLAVESSNKNKISGILSISAIEKSKHKHLLTEIIKAFPSLKNIALDKVNSFDYVSTENHLPMISIAATDPNIHFALCNFDNQIIFSKIAAEILVRNINTTI